MDSIESDLLAMKERHEKQEAATARLADAVGALRSTYAQHGVQLGYLQAAVDRHSDILTTLDSGLIIVKADQKKVLARVETLVGGQAVLAQILQQQSAQLAQLQQQLEQLAHQAAG